MRQYSDGDPLTWVSNAGGVGENRDFRRISGYWINDYCGTWSTIDGRWCSSV